MESTDNLRPVRKAILFLKAKGVDGTPLILTYASKDWGMPLFPNVELAVTGDEDNAHLCNLFAHRLAISPDCLQIRFDRADLSRGSDTVKETGDSNKARVDGNQARYIFSYGELTVSSDPLFFRQQLFHRNANDWMWVSLNALKSMNLVQKYNFDVLQFLSKSYDMTLNGLPAGINRTVKNHIPEYKIVKSINDGVFSEFFEKNSFKEFDFDLFVSFASEDRAFVESFVARLKYRGIFVWYDQDQIQFGDSLRAEIDAGLKKSHRIALILSTSYLNRGKTDRFWLDYELDGIIGAEIIKNNVVVFPIWLDVNKNDVGEHSRTLLLRKAVIATQLDPVSAADKVSNGL